MQEFVKNLMSAYKTADSREEINSYDIIGAFCACVIVLAILIIGSAL